MLLCQPETCTEVGSTKYQLLQPLSLLCGNLCQDVLLAEKHSSATPWLILRMWAYLSLCSESRDWSTHMSCTVSPTSTCERLFRKHRAAVVWQRIAA